MTENEELYFEEAVEAITTEMLTRAESMARPFYQSLGGKDPREALVACGLVMRAIVEECMLDPHDDEERNSRMNSAVAYVTVTLDHPSIKRKSRLS